MDIEPLEKVFIAKNAEELLTIAEPRYAFDDNQYQELVVPVYADGEKRLLKQRYAKPLLEILEEEELLEVGRQIHISRDEDGAYSVTFLEGGECSTVQE